jgi:mRNA interferase RelE/StbE
MAAKRLTIHIEDAGLEGRSSARPSAATAHPRNWSPTYWTSGWRHKTTRSSSLRPTPRVRSRSRKAEWKRLSSSGDSTPSRTIRLPYRVELSPAATRDIRRLPREPAGLVRAAVLALDNEPRLLGVRKLQGADQLYRVWGGEYRIVYEMTTPTVSSWCSVWRGAASARIARPVRACPGIGIVRWLRIRIPCEL